jgi:hypothetical protein
MARVRLIFLIFIADISVQHQQRESALLVQNLLGHRIHLSGVRFAQP